VVDKPIKMGVGSPEIDLFHADSDLCFQLPPYHAETQQLLRHYSAKSELAVPSLNLRENQRKYGNTSPAD